MGDNFEPKQKFRWTIEIPGINAFMVFRMRFLERTLADLWGNRLQIDYRLAETDDINRPVPIEYKEGRFKFLDKDGNITDEYALSWSGVVFYPFIDLDYTDGGAVEGRVILSNVKFTRV